ncbi:MAG: type I-E CRISPR-associated protein Cse1/CasA [Akkermansia sp.]|nr:type I-E CRISPR-associated protein Cse1/CasA [Akkermansia sp.]
MNYPNKRMSTMNLNLCTDPWLPVRMCSGACTHVSLENFFQQAHEISDLVLAAHERISIMRLLICIAQRAIDGPADRDEWDDCLKDISPASVKYLETRRHAFNLLGEDGAFLQVKGVESLSSESWGSLSKISLSAAEGNNPTIFDNAAGSMRCFSLGKIAIDLITFQNYALCGTIGVAKWNGMQTGPKSPDTASDAPCAPKSAIHLFVLGRNMLETIWLNLCTTEEFAPFRCGMGQPVWELMPVNIDDEPAVNNATLSYLGRLVPLSRIVKIAPDAGSCIVAKGIEYPVYINKDELQYFESSMTVTIKENIRSIVGASLNKAMWRSLPALLHRFSLSGKSFSRVDENDLPEQYGVWIGAMVRDKAKILSIVEDRYEHLGRNHVGVAADEVQHKLMSLANKGMASLRMALDTYHKLLHDSFENKKAVYEKVEQLYWGRLASFKEEYVKTLGSSSSKMEKYVSSREEWIRHICDTINETFNLTVSQSGVRQLAAWAGARQCLSTKQSLNKDNE